MVIEVERRRPVGEFDPLDASSPGFLPGELDQLLADIDHVREMETPCRPIY